MATKVYGHSDDLVEVEGDIRGEVSHYGSDDDGAQGVLLIFSDGTILEAKYGKASLAVWSIVLIQRGELYRNIEPCMDEDADPHSDVAHFDPGLKWCFAAKEWEKVK